MDVCSAMRKIGSMMVICDLEKDHAKHGEMYHVDSIKQQKWQDERFEGTGERTFSA